MGEWWFRHTVRAQTPWRDPWAVLLSIDLKLRQANNRSGYVLADGWLRARSVCDGFPFGAREVSTLKLDMVVATARVYSITKSAAEPHHYASLHIISHVSQVRH